MRKLGSRTRWAVTTGLLIAGLAASIWTTNLGVAHKMASRVKAGNVWINTHSAFDSALPAQMLGEAASAAGFLEIGTQTMQFAPRRKIEFERRFAVRRNRIAVGASAVQGAN